jgi:hypothetical protein
VQRTAEIAIEEHHVAANYYTYPMYVNAREGLRIRDKPGLNGDIIGRLKHKSQVFITSQSDEVDEIDQDEIAGWYYAETIEIVKSENRHSSGKSSVRSNDLRYPDKIFFEITRIGENKFFMDGNFPFFTFSRHESREFTFPNTIYGDRCLFSKSRERGGYSYSLDFYYADRQIILKLNESIGDSCDVEDGHESINERLQCVITFKWIEKGKRVTQ